MRERLYGHTEKVRGWGRFIDGQQAMHTAMDVDGALVDSSAFRASLQRVKQAADAEPAS